MHLALYQQIRVICPPPRDTRPHLRRRLVNRHLQQSGSLSLLLAHVSLCPPSFGSDVHGRVDLDTVIVTKAMCAIYLAHRVFCGWVRRMTYNRSALAADFRTISWLDDFRPLCSNGQAQDLPTCLSRNFQPDVTFSWTSSFGFNVLLQSLLKSPPIVSPGLWMLTIFLSFTIASYYDNPPPDITDSSVRSPPNVTRF